MLQTIFYIAVITQSVITIIVLITIVVLFFRIYKFLSETITQVQEKAAQINDVITDVSEKGSGLLRLATKEGQQAVATSTVLSILMNGYFILRTLFGHKKK